MKNYGFIKPEIRPEDYVFGGVTKLSAVELRPNGQWDDFLPEKELQERNGLETSNCTVFGSINILETLHRCLFNKEENWSERFIGVLADTTPAGNSVTKVMDTIRKQGMIPEKLLPFSDDIDEWDKYYAPKPMTEQFILIAKNWLTFYSVGYEWVFTTNSRNKISKLKDALRFSPIGVSVLAWYGPNEKGLYYKPESGSNHWCMIYGYVEEGPIKFWKCYDHYDNTIKKLEWNFDFDFAMRCVLQKKTITEPAKEEVKSNIQKALDIIKKQIECIRQEIEKLKGRLKGLFK